MEVDVVHQEHSRILQRREQAGDLVCQRRGLLRCRALRREASRSDLEDSPCLVHLVAGEAVQRRQETQRFRTQPGGPSGMNVPDP